MRAMLTDIVTRYGPSSRRPLPLRTGPARTLDVDIDLGDRRLTGTVGNVFGNNLVAVSYSSLGAKHRLAAWLDALALAAGQPDENWTAHTIGRWGRSGRRALISPMTDDDARTHLRDLVDVMERGQREPLPLPVKTSLAFAEEFEIGAPGARRPRRQGQRRVGDPALQRLRLPEGGRRPVARARVGRVGPLRPAGRSAAPRRGGRGAAPARPLRPARLVAAAVRRAGAGDLT